MVYMPMSQHGPTAANLLLQVCNCGHDWQETAIDCCTIGAQQQRRAEGVCGQCHVVSVRRMLNTDLLLLLLLILLTHFYKPAILDLLCA